MSVAVAALAFVIFTTAADPKLKVGRLTAPAGLEEIVAVILTEPVNPPAGVIVIVEVFPVVAPALTVTAAPLIENPDGVKLRVYCAVAMALAVYPGATAIAWRVSDEETVIALVYIVELVVGTVPSVV